MRSRERRFRAESYLHERQPGTPEPVRAAKGSSWPDRLLRQPEPARRSGRGPRQESRTTTRNRIPTSACASRSWAERTPPPNARSSSSVPECRSTLIHRGPRSRPTSSTGSGRTSRTESSAGEVEALLETEVESRSIRERCGFQEEQRRPIRDRERRRARLTGYHPDYRFLSVDGDPIDSESGKPETRSRRPARRTCPGSTSPAASSPGSETNKIFIENGRFHGKKIVEHVAGS